MSRERVPVGPLFDGDRRSVAQVATAAGASHRTVWRWRQAGTVPLDYADEAAIGLGLHPSILWDDW